MDAPFLNNCSIFLDEADAENGSIRKSLPEIDGDSDNLDQLINEETRSLVKEFGANSAEFRSYLKSLDLTRLRFHNYDTFYLNLLSVFGNRLSYKEIEELAKKCTRFRVWNSWEYHYRIRSQVLQKDFEWNHSLNNWN